MVDKLTYREAMSKLASAVCVVTSNGKAGLSGATVSAVCSVTDEPATLLVCVNQTARSNAIIKENGVLCVNVLAGQSHQIADTFSGSAGISAETRFSYVDFSALTTGAPVFDEALVAFDCVLHQTIEMGTHSIFLARVVAIGGQEMADCLVYFQRKYLTLEVEGTPVYDNQLHEAEYGQESQSWRLQSAISASW